VPRALVCVDLDGTTVESSTIHAWFSEAVADELNAACRAGAAWCTNSGRNPHNQFGLIQACRRLEFLPRIVLSNERYIFDVDPLHGLMRPRYRTTRRPGPRAWI